MECVHVHVHVRVHVVDVVVEGARLLHLVLSIRMDSILGFPTTQLSNEPNSHWEIAIAAICLNQLIELDGILVIDGIMSILSIAAPRI